MPVVAPAAVLRNSSRFYNRRWLLCSSLFMACGCMRDYVTLEYGARRHAGGGARLGASELKALRIIAGEVVFRCVHGVWLYAWLRDA